MGKNKKTIVYLSGTEAALLSRKLQNKVLLLQEKLQKVTDRYITIASQKEKLKTHLYRRVFRLSRRMQRLKTRIQRLEIAILKISEGKWEKLSRLGKFRKAFSEMPYRTQKNIFGILFLSPWMIGCLLFFVIPIITAFWWSLNDMDTLQGGGYRFAFIGLKNYLDAFTTAMLGETTISEKLTVSVIDILLNLPTIVIFSLFIAVLLNTKFKGHQLMKAIFFIPVVYNMTAITNTLEGQFGTVFASAVENGFVLSDQFSMFLMQIGIGNGLIEFLIGAVNRIFTIVNMSGIQIIIFLAALQSIPRHLYEAAKVEGATRFDMLCKITIPMVSPMVLPVVVYTIVDSFSVSDIMRSMTVNSQGTTMATNNPGLFSAISFIYFAVNALIIAIVFALMKKAVFYNDR